MKYLFRLILIVIWSFVFIAASVAYALDRPLRVRVVHNYPPFYFKDTSGAWKGMELEIVAAVLKECGYSWELVEAEWARGLKWLETGQVDLMMSLTKTPERETFIDFIGITKYEQMSLIVRKENVNLPIRKLDDLMAFDLPFGYQSGVVYPNLSERIEADADFRNHMYLVYNEELSIKMTAQKRMMGFFEDRTYAQYSMKTNSAFKELKIHSFSLSVPKPVYLGASLKLQDAVRDRLKKAYRKLQAAGVLEEIRRKWTQ